MTTLRESGRLLHQRGRLIVGILVVEDFAAPFPVEIICAILGVRRPIGR
jgi:predicted Kef-type K+ transport protein